MIWDKLKEEDWVKIAPYVDTLLVPVHDINLESKTSLHVGHQDCLQTALEIERQLTGRVMLMPPISYVADEPWLQPYVTSIRNRAESAGFNHLFFLIAADTFKKTEHINWGNVLNTDEEIRHLCEQLVQKWQEEV